MTCGYWMLPASQERKNGRRFCMIVRHPLHHHQRLDLSTRWWPSELTYISLEGAAQVDAWLIFTNLIPQLEHGLP